MNFLAGYIMRGPMQALFVASVCAVMTLILPPLGFLSGAAVALVTLRLGAWQGARVVLGASLSATAMSLLLIGSPALGPALLVALLPVWAMALELRRTVSLGRALLMAGGFGVLFVAVLHGAVDDPAAFWRTFFERMFKEAGAQPPAAMEDVYAIMTRDMAAGVALSLAASLLTARWWQARLYNAGGFQREFHALRFSPLLSLATLGVAGLAFLGDGRLAAFTSDLIGVFVVLHLLHGFAVVHGLVKRKGAHASWLAFMYVLLLLPQTTTQAAIALSAVGLADAWFDFRAFFGGKREEGKNG